MTEYLSFKSNFAEKRGKHVRFFFLGDVLDRGGTETLVSVMGEEAAHRLLNQRLERDEARETYVKTCLELVASGLDNKDSEKVMAGLIGIGVGVTSLMETELGDMQEFMGKGGVTRESTGKYAINLGSGTSGKRILIIQRRDGEYQRLLLFPSQGERISGDCQRAIQLLFGSRVVNIAEAGHDPYLAISVIDENDIDDCPCGSKKTYKECHGV